MRRLSDMFARSMLSSCTVQILATSDLDFATWSWADWVLLGVSYAMPLSKTSLVQALNKMGAPTIEPKPFALFQVQTRTDTPLSAAYGFSLARALRARELRLIAKPIVFFCDEPDLAEQEGECLRALQWAQAIAQLQLEFKTTQG